MKLEEKLLAFVNASASEQELQKLKGIGKVHSKKIMEFKEKNGSFYSFEDMQRKLGFSEKAIASFIDKNLGKFIEISY